MRSKKKKKIDWMEWVGVVLVAVCLFGGAVRALEIVRDILPMMRGDENIIVAGKEEVVKGKIEIPGCNVSIYNSWLSVYLAERDPKSSLGGYFNSETVSITFIDTTINTIAHEVSHYVDYVMKSRDVHDEEARAYLQGYVTECVYASIKFAQGTSTRAI